MVRIQYLFFISIVIFSGAAILASRESETDWAKKMEKLQEMAKNNHFQDSLGHQHRATGTNDFDVSFTCEPKPQSVHELRPRDIDVIGAMGDSLTAANGGEADTIVGVAREYRGMSWFAGGEGNLSTTLTIPNIIRLFNPKVQGYSVGTRFEEGRDWWFNVAEPGARANDMPKQAQILVEEMMNDNRTNFENDWKLVTIFIGGNDLCVLKSDDSQPETYVAYLRQALDILHEKLPRTLVNVVEILEIYLLPEVAKAEEATAVCKIAQQILCNYVVTAKDEELEFLKEQNRFYQKLTQDLIYGGRYDTKDDFTVVLQPFFRETELPLTEDGDVDTTFFAPDCFHFGAKGHAMGALNLWNNMLEPVGEKSTRWSISDLKCPTEESPYIFTNVNSDFYGSGEPPTTTIESMQPTTEILLKTTKPQVVETTKPQVVETTKPQVVETTKPQAVETTKPQVVETTKPGVVVTTTSTDPPKECDDVCVAPKVDDWVIAVMCLLAAAVLAQSFILYMVMRRKNYYKQTSYSLDEKM